MPKTETMLKIISYSLKILILLTFSFYSRAQLDSSFKILSGSNLLYSYDLTGTNNNAFMIPFIELSLKQLTIDKNRKEANLFDSITNLNLLLAKKEISSKIMKAFLYFDRSRTILKETDLDNQKIEKEITTALKKNDYFLLININTLNTLIEFQFILFKIVKPVDNNTLGDIDQTIYRTSSVFVDPNNSDYKDKIIFALKQIFYESDDEPEPVIIRTNKEASKPSYVLKNIQFTLTASQKDDDSPLEQMTYKWDVINPDGTIFFIPDPFNKNLTLKLEDDGEYKIRLSVNDGIKTGFKSYTFITAERPSVSVRFKNDEDVGYIDDRTNVLYNFSFFKEISRSVILKNRTISLSGFLVQTKLSNSIKLFFILDSSKSFDGVYKYFPLHEKSNSIIENKKLNIYIEDNHGVASLFKELDSVIYEYNLGASQIKNPSNITIAVVVTNKAELSDTAYITYQFNKVNRVLLDLDLFSYNSGKKDSLSTRSVSFSIGFSYVLSKISSIHFTSGLTGPTSDLIHFPKKFNSGFFKTYFLINLKDGNYFEKLPAQDIVIAYCNRPIYNYIEKTEVSRSKCFGIGLQLNNQPNIFALDNFLLGGNSSFIYYPKSLNNLNFSFFEFSIKFNLFFYMK